MQGNIPLQNNVPVPSFRLVLAANEGALSAVAGGKAATFTFNIPPGAWQGASISLYAESATDPTAENSNSFVYAQSSAFIADQASPLSPCGVELIDGLNGPLLPYLTIPINGNTPRNPGEQGAEFSVSGTVIHVGEPSAVNPVGAPGPTPGARDLPIAALTGGGMAGASVLVQPPEKIGTATNNPDTALSGITAFLTLIAVPSVPAAVQVTASGSVSGLYPNLTYTGTATAAVVPSGVVDLGDPNGGQTPPDSPLLGTTWTDGVGPYSYHWNGFGGTELTGQGTDTVSWSFTGDSIFYSFGFSCTVTNGPLPNEPGAATYTFPQVPVPGQTSAVLTTQLGATTTSLAVGYEFQEPTAASLACLFLSVDAARRPLAAGAGNGAPATGHYSNDAGHSFAAGVIDADATCADISLLLDRHTSRYSALYTKGQPGSEALYAAFGPVVDSFAPDAPPAAATGISGLYPIACEHPTERGAALLLLVSGGNPATGAGGSLVAAETGDYGENWTQAGTVAAGVDFSQSGRAGLCFVGDTAFTVYASGSGLACAKSVDRGHTWTPCASAAGGLYSGLSLLGWQGTLYLLAFAAPATAGASAVPALFVSDTLGDAWAAGAALPKIAIPSALGIMPETSQIRLGLTHHSDDDTAAWLAD